MNNTFYTTGVFRNHGRLKCRSFITHRVEVNEAFFWNMLFIDFILIIYDSLLLLLLLLLSTVRRYTTKLDDRDPKLE